MFNTKKKIQEIRRKWGKKLSGDDGLEDRRLDDEISTESQKVDSSETDVRSPNWWLVAGVAIATTIVVGVGAFTFGYAPKFLTSFTSQATTDLRIKGNKNSHIYHLPGCPNYNDISDHNVVWFRTHEDAKKAGYRMAKNC